MLIWDQRRSQKLITILRYKTVSHLTLTSKELRCYRYIYMNVTWLDIFTIIYWKPYALFYYVNYILYHNKLTSYNLFMLELFFFHEWLQFPKHLTITLHQNTIYLGNSGNGSWNTSHEQKSYSHHRFFLSSLIRLRITGAAGMLNHQSLNLLIHLSVLDLLTGEYLVNVSKKASRKICLTGNKARSNARTKSATANLSVAWTLKYRNETQAMERQ